MPGHNPNGPPALVLAGGRATRLGGEDKALLLLAGRPLVSHLVARLRPQVSTIVLNGNLPVSRYEKFGLRVLPDRIRGQPGPLAGIHAGLAAFPESSVLTVAVDLPLIPADLVVRLASALDTGRCAYASVSGRHALAILWPPGMVDEIARAIDHGQHSVRALLAKFGNPVEFVPTPEADLSLNINTPEDREKVEQRLRTLTS